LDTNLSKKENMPIGLDNLVLSGCHPVLDPVPCYAIVNSLIRSLFQFPEKMGEMAVDWFWKLDSREYGAIQIAKKHEIHCIFPR
jgi:hypothetical protein